jgi:hypothetical protein
MAIKPNPNLPPLTNRDPGLELIFRIFADKVSAQEKKEWAKKKWAHYYVKCDGFTVGGGYDGLIKYKVRIHRSEDKNVEKSYSQLRHNIISVKRYLRIARKHPVIVPFALLAPDGTWHEGKTNIYGDYTPKERKKWIKKALNIIEQYPAHSIIGMDCHK